MITGNEPINPTIWDDRYQPEFVRDNDGLTIREHFAAMAMQGLLSIYSVGDGINPPIVPNEENIKYMIALSIKASDELIKELNKEK